MCEPSPIFDDWVTKGFHIYVEGVELAVFSDHKGEVGFRPFFASTSEEEGRLAVKVAYDVCLEDDNVRMKWIKRLGSARLFMLGYPGELNSLANGRMAEFKFLRIALERWSQ